jgi:hypothetical protein
MTKLSTFVVSLMVAAGVGIRPTPAAAAASARQIANDVRTIFSAKCALCHGPDVPHPKCRFGYVTDLARVAGNPEIVIPNSPNESELWTLVSRGEMPPSDSPHGPLSVEQKELVRSWIKSGAPDPSAPEQAPATIEKAETIIEPTVAVPTEPTLLHRLLTWIGKFHLLMIHFPIALVLAAVTAEIL